MVAGKQDASYWKGYYLMKFEYLSRTNDDLSVLNQLCHELIKLRKSESLWTRVDFPAYKAGIEGLEQAITEIELKI